MANENLVVARFFNHTTHNPSKSKAAGRPIYDEFEACELRFAGNKQTVAVFPAHEVFTTHKDMQSGHVEPTTYAMAYPDQYKQFKNGEAQVQGGTPLSELPFLTQGKRMELKALNIHTAEALASVDGQPLKQLGPGGRELKNQAQAYIDAARGSVDVLGQAARIAQLEEQIASLLKAQQATQAPAETDDGVSPFGSWEDEDLKNWLAEATGERPKGNPNHATLVRRCDEVNADLAKKAKAAA